MAAFPPLYPILPPGQGQGPRTEEASHIVVAHALDLPQLTVRYFALPVELPPGAPKLRLLSRGKATTGNLAFDVAWAIAEAGDDPSTIVAVYEGVTVVTWSTSGGLHDTRVPLDAAAFVAGGILVTRLTFRKTGSTIAVETGHLPMLIWE